MSEEPRGDCLNCLHFHEGSAGIIPDCDYHGRECNFIDVHYWKYRMLDMLYRYWLPETRRLRASSRYFRRITRKLLREIEELQAENAALQEQLNEPKCDSCIWKII